MTSTLNVGGADNYRALAEGLTNLPSETLQIITAHIAAERNRRTALAIRLENAAATRRDAIGAAL